MKVVHWGNAAVALTFFHRHRRAEPLALWCFKLRIIWQEMAELVILSAQVRFDPSNSKFSESPRSDQPAVQFVLTMATPDTPNGTSPLPDGPDGAPTVLDYRAHDELLARRHFQRQRLSHRRMLPKLESILDLPEYGSAPIAISNQRLHPSREEHIVHPPPN
jgi:hypothetical protein